MAYLEIQAAACRQGQWLPLSARQLPGPGHMTDILPQLPVGATLGDMRPLFVVAGSMWAPFQPAQRLPLLLALEDIAESMPLKLNATKRGYSFAAITLSDKGAKGLREDRSGPLMTQLVCGQLPVCFSQNFILPDDDAALRGLLAELALEQQYDLICTSGGTGLSTRDVTPQATASLLDLELPGFTQAMMLASLQKTPMAAISRAVAGIIGRTLVINLPGSVKAVHENLGAVLPALEHALAKLHDDPVDCGG